METFLRFKCLGKCKRDDLILRRGIASCPNCGGALICINVSPELATELDPDLKPDTKH